MELNNENMPKKEGGNNVPPAIPPRPAEPKKVYPEKPGPTQGYTPKKEVVNNFPPAAPVRPVEQKKASPERPSSTGLSEPNKGLTVYIVAAALALLLISFLLLNRPVKLKEPALEIKKGTELVTITLSLPSGKNIEKATAVFDNGVKQPLIKAAGDNQWQASVKKKELKKVASIKVYFQAPQGKPEFIKKEFK